MDSRKVVENSRPSLPDVERYFKRHGFNIGQTLHDT